MAKESDFDYEKNRIENPMDYLKAISLIESDPSNAEVMKTIYSITRIYVPDTVYKYCSLYGNDDVDIAKLNTLKNKKIYLATSDQFNDPFDTKAFFYDYKFLSRHERLKHCNGRIFSNLSEYVRIASFTTNGVNSMPMWAHYANNHKGFCIAYNPRSESNISLSSNLFQVQYIDSRIDITHIIDSFVSEVIQEIEKTKRRKEKLIHIDNLIIFWISVYYSCLKHTTWSYENEYRCVSSPESPGTPYRVAFPSDIYIGAQCTPQNVKRLLDIGQELKVPVYQMQFDEYSLKYELRPNCIL